MTIVAAPRAQAPRMGLLVSAQSPPADDPADWTKGLSYQPETCGGWTTIGQCTTTDRGAVPPETPVPVGYLPWAVEVTDACTTMGGDLDEERLRRRLDQRFSAAVAREMWLGDQRDLDGSPNVALTDATTTSAPVTVLNGGAALGAKRALGELEAALGGCTHGQQGMIHVPSLAGPHIAALCDRTGQLLTTKAADHVVSVDTGYPTGAGSQPTGSGNPAAGQVWLYATPMVTVRQGPVVVEGVADAQSVNVRTNLRSRRAWRLAAATWDTCCRFAVLLDLTAA